MNTRNKEAATEFNQHKPRLLSLAYRMLGCLSDAEDIVQEAYLKWHSSQTIKIDNPGAWLTTVSTRLCIDKLRARQRQSYTGPWLPEPISDNELQEMDCAQGAVLSEQLQIAFLLLLEDLNPVERAVFILRQAFDFKHDDIASFIGKTSANIRQIDHRAKRKIQNHASIPSISGDQAEAYDDHQQLLQGFINACISGNSDDIKQQLVEDVVMYSDGGGKAMAALRPIFGADKVIRFVLGLRKKLQGTLQMQQINLNGKASVLLHSEHSLHSAISISTQGPQITAVYMLRNPDKLQHLHKYLSAG